jgi:hypothetical protein
MAFVRSKEEEYYVTCMFCMKKFEESEKEERCMNRMHEYINRNSLTTISEDINRKASLDFVRTP